MNDETNETQIRDEQLNDYKYSAEFLEIITYPHPTLKKKAIEVTEFNEELNTTVHKMLNTMYKAPGIGLAAPQVNLSQRFFVLDVDYDHDVDEETQSRKIFNQNPMVFINPKIVAKEGTIKYQEGCLSLPGIYEDVDRDANITLEYQNLKGEVCNLQASDLLSICIQHELDHLDGIVFVDRLSFIKKNLHLKKLLKSKKK